MALVALALGLALLFAALAFFFEALLFLVAFILFSFFVAFCVVQMCECVASALELF